MGEAFTWREKLEGFFAPLLDFIFPPHCVLCGAHLARHEVVVCCDCWLRLPLCRTPLIEYQDGNAFNGQRCHLGTSVAVWGYSEEVEQVIHLFKYGGYSCLARPLGLAMAGVLVSAGLACKADVLAPIPLHPARRRERGYNQSELLARQIGKVTGLPVAARLLHRTRYTKPQAQLGAAERAKNVAGAFAASSPALAQNRSIVLVDDVLTTGATANECARVLKEAGAAQVFLATAARA